MDELKMTREIYSNSENEGKMLKRKQDRDGNGFDEEIIFKLDNVAKQVRDGDDSKNILEDISLEVRKGEFVGISGDSGAGKSTLLHIIGGLDDFSSGTLTFEGQSMSAMTVSEIVKFRRKIGFVFQESYLIEHLNIIENVLLPLKIRNLNNKAEKNKAVELLKEVGIASIQGPQSSSMKTIKNKLNQLPRTLSGGEKQRVSIARAVLMNPSAILADEPTGSLDKENEGIVFKILQKMNEDYGITIVLVSHNQNLINKCSRVIRVGNGRIIG
jgi:ABC-type lipoprotein export system ATPase subunit